jgi:uncharacterized protein YutE (UPF0331/DUF86 family)
MTEYLALSAVLRQKLADLLRLVERIESLLQKSNLSKDDDYIDGIALHLQGFYTTIEQMLEAIAAAFGEGLPAGANWHQNLLLQMSIQIPDIRPAVISQQTRQKLDEYRGFRHVVRNVYTLNLRPSRVRELVGTLRDCYEFLANDLEKFCGFMESMVRNG